MRAVNLLPDARRARSGVPAIGPAHATLVVLGVLLVAVIVYLLAVNQVISREQELARLQGETRQAEARAAALGAFGDFARVKQERARSVIDLARARFDWERLVREIAHLVPTDAWLTALEATSTPQASGATAPAGAAPGTASTGPSLKLTGCAPSQPSVATVLVRLRRLRGAEEVKLAQSKRGERSAAAAATAGAPARAGCGDTRGRPNYQWDVTIALAPQGRPEQERGNGRAIPPGLGGGE